MKYMMTVDLLMIVQLQYVYFVLDHESINTAVQLSNTFIKFFKYLFKKIMQFFQKSIDIHIQRAIFKRNVWKQENDSFVNQRATNWHKTLLIWIPFKSPQLLHSTFSLKITSPTAHSGNQTHKSTQPQYV